MTEEYKDLLFDYLMGDINTTPSSTEEVFISKKVATTDLMSLLPAGTTTYYIYGIISNNDGTGEIYALYGGYGVSDNNENGFIALLDSQFNINKKETDPQGTASSKKNKKGLASVILAPIRLIPNWYLIY